MPWVASLSTASRAVAPTHVNALGIEALEMLAPMLPGVPLCRVHAPGSAAHGLEAPVEA